MLKQKLKNRLALKPLLMTVVLGASMVAATTYSAFTGYVRADTFDQQIQQLQTQNSSAQSDAAQEGAQATSYQDQLNQLDAQINGLQQSIVQTQQQSDQLQQQIAADQAQIDQQKQVLGDDIKAMYLEGQVSTLEILASSTNLSDFVNKEVDRSVVQDKVKESVDTITSLKLNLQQQNAQLQVTLASLQNERSQLSDQEAQQSQLLAYSENQIAADNQQIASNNSQITTLRAEQIAANRALVGTGKVDFSGTCGGSYPATAVGPDGNWGCNYALDNTIDNWGMDNRECVSYTAWMVNQTYHDMPYWGGAGNANQWPGDAAADGIPTGNTPEVNSVAIYMGGSSDPFGHAMWVKSINGDGTITVDQYNLYYDGNFYETTIPSSGLVYIYFSGVAP
jgi:peptidoglycan hydrolase CwlO-like protein/surface antigen